VITAKPNKLYSIKPSYTSALVLAAAKGGQQNGTSIVLETESGKPWQEWNLKKNEDGSYCVIPHHASAKGLDHLGGRPVAGAKIDLWANNPGDRHLE
jgi:gluconolactonase